MASAAAKDRATATASRGEDGNIYQRCVFDLLARGHVPGVKLDHFAWRLLLFLLGQGPDYIAKRKTLAQKLDTNETTVKVALGRLRDAKVAPGVALLESELKVPLNSRLPWRPGSKANANLNGYRVAAEALLARLRDVDAQERRKAESVQRRPARVDPAGRPTAPKSVRTSGLNPARTLSGSMDGLITTPPPPPSTTRAARTGEGRGKAVKNPITLEIRAVADDWRSLALGPALGERELQALANRAAEGRSLDELRQAVRGASHPEQAPWLRSDRCRKPFAVVFADVASVGRFAAYGRQLSLGEGEPNEVTLEACLEQGRGNRPDELLARGTTREMPGAARLGGVAKCQKEPRDPRPVAGRLAELGVGTAPGKQSRAATPVGDGAARSGGLHTADEVQAHQERLSAVDVERRRADQISRAKSLAAQWELEDRAAQAAAVEGAREHRP